MSPPSGAPESAPLETAAPDAPNTIEPSSSAQPTDVMPVMPPAPEPIVVAHARVEDRAEDRVSDAPVTKKEGSGRHRAAAVASSSAAEEPGDAQQLDTASIQPVTRDHGGEPDMDFGDEEEHGDFFAKSLEEVHHEEAVREAPELHDPELAPAPVYRRKGVDRRARSIVMGVLGVCALIGATAMVRRATSATPPSSLHTTAAMVDNAAPPPPAETQAAPPPPAETQAAPTPAPTNTVAAAAETAEPSVAATTTATEAATAQPTPAPTDTVAAPTVAAPTTTTTTVAAATPTPTTTAATAPTTATTAAAAAAAPGDDPDAALSGPQLLAAARKAINSNPSKAATLARKAATKGAGGSAYYVLGAAYQMMGATSAAKNAYASCAKSGAAEAGECAALVENM